MLLWTYGCDSQLTLWSIRIDWYPISKWTPGLSYEADFYRYSHAPSRFRCRILFQCRRFVEARVPDAEDQAGLRRPKRTFLKLIFAAARNLYFLLDFLWAIASCQARGYRIGVPRLVRPQKRNFLGVVICTVTNNILRYWSPGTSRSFIYAMRRTPRCPGTRYGKDD